MQNEILKENNSIYMLKGIATLLVIIVHSTQCFPDLNYFFVQVSRLGRWGCQLFFVISGFLLIQSWNNKTNIINFYKKRFCSLVPAYYLAICFYVGLNLIWNNETEMFYPFNITKLSILSNILLLHGFSSSSFNAVVPGGWFIGTQCIFLLLFPLLLFFYKIKNTKIIPYYCFVISFFLQMFVYFLTGDFNTIKITSFLHYSFINQLPCFLLGISLYFEYNETNFVDKKISSELVFTVIWGLFATLIFYLHNKSFVFSISVAFIYSNSFKHLLTAGILFNKQELIKKHFLVKLGRKSYAAYYTNFIICMFLPWIFFRVINLNFNYTVIYVACVIPMILGTYASAVLFDRMLRLFTLKLNVIFRLS